jgi:hypothetical protein
LSTFRRNVLPPCSSKPSKKQATSKAGGKPSVIHINEAKELRIQIHGHFNNIGSADENKLKNISL